MWIVKCLEANCCSPDLIKTVILRLFVPCFLSVIYSSSDLIHRRLLATKFIFNKWSSCFYERIFKEFILVGRDTHKFEFASCPFILLYDIPYSSSRISNLGRKFSQSSFDNFSCKFNEYIFIHFYYGMMRKKTLSIDA